MASPSQQLLRQLPAVDEILHDADLTRLVAGLPRPVLAGYVREAIEQVRKALLAASISGVDADSLRRSVLAILQERIETSAGPYLRRAINATGIILHTGLGRAVLAGRAVRQIEEQLLGYSVLQTDAATGKRSRRDVRIESLLQQLTGAEAATVVNNNAAATWIVLNTVAAGKEVIISRGQLVEIGGSFRLPDVMAASGARLVEVGTTNKTHARDYERAITANTAAIMRVHPSNYKISGFTAEVPLAEMVRIARAHKLVLIDDVGAGSLVDFSRFGFQPEPTLPESVQGGADLMTSSADKMIGGPQAGLILGRAPLVQAVRKNPFARIVRVDKLTLAALEATLSLFLDQSQALQEVPTLRMLRRPLGEIADQTERIAKAIRQSVPAASIRVIDGFSQMGSGSLPTQNLATRLVAVRLEGTESGELGTRLRRQSPPVFTRVHKGEVLIDPRTLLDGEEAMLIQAFVRSLSPS